MQWRTLLAPIRLLRPYGRGHRLCLSRAQRPTEAAVRSRELSVSTTLRPCSVSLIHDDFLQTCRKIGSHTHYITTFDSTHLRPSDFLDLSSKTCTVVHAADKLGNVDMEHKPCTLRYGHLKRFPAEAAGFLYYHSHPDLPAASEVRFRITPTADPAAWASGRDLLRTDGTPWSFPTIFLAQAEHERVKRHVQSYAGFWSVLQRDGLVSDALRRQCHALITASEHSFHPTSRFYHSLDQLFPIDLAGPYLGLYVVRGSRIASMRIRDLFSQRMDRKCVSPYTGQFASVPCVFDYVAIILIRAQDLHYAVSRSPRCHLIGPGPHNISSCASSRL